MDRREFMVASTLLGTPALLSAESVMGPSVSDDIELSELTTTEYRYILKDFKERFPQHSEDLYRHMWLVSDNYWESQDGNYPGHEQMTEEEELCFEKTHGFKNTYYWRGHADVARRLLKGENPHTTGAWIETKDGISVYQNKWSDEVIDINYVFHKKNAVAHIGLSIKD